MENNIYEGLNSDVLKLALDQATKNVEHITKAIEALRQRAGNLLLVVLISVSSLMLPWLLGKLYAHELLFIVVGFPALFYGIATRHIWKILTPKILPVPALPPDWFGENGSLYKTKSQNVIFDLLRELQAQSKIGDEQIDNISEKLEKAYKRTIVGSILLILISVIVLFV